MVNAIACVHVFYLSLHYSMADVINHLKSQIKDGDFEMRVHRSQVMEDALKHNITPTKNMVV